MAAMTAESPAGSSESLGAGSMVGDAIENASQNKDISDDFIALIAPESVGIEAGPRTMSGESFRPA